MENLLFSCIFRLFLQNSKEQNIKICKRKTLRYINKSLFYDVGRGYCAINFLQRFPLNGPTTVYLYTCFHNVCTFTRFLIKIFCHTVTILS